MRRHQNSRNGQEVDMLTKTDNELLTRVGPGTPMGDTLRQYWLPLLLTEELADNEGNPQRIRVLGENLIAFRDTEGAIGLLAENCPHRGASLFFARNEQCGLRCVYHGWKFDTAGHCVDMPNEPPESNFKDKVRTVAYPCLDRQGVVWTYMGPPERQPAPPSIEWSLVPAEQRFLSKRLQQSHYLQAVEGGIHATVDDGHQPLANIDNDYLIDRQAQRTQTFSGIRGISEQDMACQESMGPIYDRSNEHLGTSDSAIIAMRRQLLKLGRMLQDG